MVATIRRYGACPLFLARSFGSSSRSESLGFHVGQNAAFSGPCAPINGVGIDDEFGIDLDCEPAHFSALRAEQRMNILIDLLRPIPTKMADDGIAKRSQSITRRKGTEK